MSVNGSAGECWDVVGRGGRIYLSRPRLTSFAPFITTNPSTGIGSASDSAAALSVSLSVSVELRVLQPKEATSSLKPGQPLEVWAAGRSHQRLKLSPRRIAGSVGPYGRFSTCVIHCSGGSDKVSGTVASCRSGLVGCGLCWSPTRCDVAHRAAWYRGTGKRRIRISASPEDSCHSRIL
jgi:hypothetical protein